MTFAMTSLTRRKFTLNFLSKRISNPGGLNVTVRCLWWRIGNKGFERQDVVIIKVDGSNETLDRLRWLSKIYATHLFIPTEVHSRRFVLVLSILTWRRSDSRLFWNAEESSKHTSKFHWPHNNVMSLSDFLVVIVCYFSAASGSDFRPQGRIR